jgi:hypothetical protein
MKTQKNVIYLKREVKPINANTPSATAYAIIVIRTNRQFEPLMRAAREMEKKSIRGLIDI